MDADALRCVLTHWYELRAPKEKIGSENNKRLTEIKGLHMVFRRQGIDALRGQLHAGAASQRVIESAALPIGGGLFPDDLDIETFVRRSLNAQRQDYRLAALYAAVFYMKKSELLACHLTETTMLGTGLEQLAAAEAVRLAQRLPCAACAKHRWKEPMSWCPARGT